MFRAITVSGPVLIALAVAAASPAGAGTELVFEDLGDEPAETARLQVEDGALVLHNMATGSDGRVLFDADAQRMTLVDDEARSYMIFEEENVRRIAAVQAQIQRYREVQLKRLPEERRERASAMMQAMGTGLPAAGQPQRIVPTGETGTVDDLECRVLEVFSGEELVSRQCVANAEALGVEPQDIATITAMQQFLASMISSIDFAAERLIEFGVPGRQEIPIRYEHFSGAGAAGQLKAVKHSPLRPEQLAIPEGYQQRKLPRLEQR